MGLFERYLTLWVALGIGAGVALGLMVPVFFKRWPRWSGRM